MNIVEPKGINWIYIVMNHMRNGGACMYLDGAVVIFDKEQQRFKYRDQENGWSASQYDSYNYLDII